jgi:hypothetical protein
MAGNADLPMESSPVKPKIARAWLLVTVFQILRTFW